MEMDFDISADNLFESPVKNKEHLVRHNMITKSVALDDQKNY